MSLRDSDQMRPAGHRVFILGVFILSVWVTHCCYPGPMISYKRSNPLQPEKESVVQINLMPLLVFALGFLLTRTLLNSVKTDSTNTVLK